MSHIEQMARFANIEGIASIIARDHPDGDQVAVAMVIRFLDLLSVSPSYACTPLYLGAMRDALLAGAKMRLDDQPMGGVRVVRVEGESQ